MASSSSSPFPPLTWKYDVFPSFSGEDVRKSFLSHLIKALRQKTIITFIDDDMERSCRIAPVLLDTIRQSRISIVVFSNKYATSTWCLNELAEIHECSKKSGYIVIPIFYNVDASDVRNQRGEFGKAFEETCKRKTEDDKLRWKNALYDLAGVAGFVCPNGRDEAEIIESITNDVLNKLVSTPFDDFADYVGIQTHIEKVMDSLLCLQSGGVRMVGIVGTSGIGKTTIARALYNRLSSHFDHRVFASYKRTIQNDDSMKLAWANQFLSEILGQDIKIESLGMVEQRLKHRKVLIVLDNVTELELLEALVGQPEWFGFESRIIVTTQDKALLESHGIKLFYEMEFPSEELALQMFCWSAFKRDSPPDDFRYLAMEVAKLAGNLPLGLKVLGSWLRRKNKEKWVEMMPRLQKFLNGKIEKTLRVSYDGLEEKDVQDIFLYIACLFNGQSADYVVNLLDGGLYNGVRSMLTTLVDKSLIRITALPHETVQMHILLEELGRDIARAESIDNPGERRFVLDAKDTYDVILENTGTSKVVAIIYDTLEIKEPLPMDKETFRRMHNIQFLKLCKKFCSNEGGFHLPQGLDYWPRKLRLLHWEGYPAKHLPSSFSVEYLVELIMTDSKLEKLWEGTLPLEKLRKMNLSNSLDLKEIPDLSNATNLESLDLTWCFSLETLPSTIRNLKKLKKLKMSGCELTALPTDVDLFSLDLLDLRVCRRLRSFPRISKNISKLHLDGTSMEEEDCSWIKNLSQLTVLRWKKCPLRCMPSNFDPQHLMEIILTDSKLEKLWERVQTFRYLEKMDLSGCGSLEEIPDLSTAINLYAMNMSGCKNLKEIPDLSKATKIWTLDLSDCTSVVMLPSSIQHLHNLIELNMRACRNLKEIPDLSKATKIEKLDLSDCTSVVMLPSSIQHLHNLIELNMRACRNLKEIPDLSKATKIEKLDLRDCTSVVILPSSIQHLHKLKELDMRGCTSLEVIPTNINLVSLLDLLLNGCSRLTSFPQLSTSIKRLYLDDTAIEEVPSWIENITGLEKLSMTGCKKLRKIAASISNLKNLLYADFTGVTSDTVKERALLMALNRHLFKSSDSGTKFIFCNSFNLDRDAHELIRRSDFGCVVLPGKEVPTYFTHRTCGTSLVVLLPQRSLAQNSLRFKACVVLHNATYGSNVHFRQTIIVGCKLRGVTTGKCYIDPAIVYCERDHLVVFHFDFYPRQEVDPPLSIFEFKIRCYGVCDVEPCPLHFNIKGCGVHDVSNDRSSESDVEIGRGKNQMLVSFLDKINQFLMMQITRISQEPSNQPCGQTAGDTGIPDLNMELSLGLSGDETSLHDSLSPSYSCLEGEAFYLDRTTTEQQDTQACTCSLRLRKKENGSKIKWCSESVTKPVVRCEMIQKEKSFVIFFIFTSLVVFFTIAMYLYKRRVQP